MSANAIDHEVFLRICREHAEMRELITTLLRVLAEKREPPARLYRLLKLLNELLIKHFSDEEGTGLFNNLTSAAPHAQHSTQKLLAEHPHLLKQMSDLLDGVNQTQLTRMQWMDLEERFRLFSTKLMHHEARENELAEHAFAEEEFNLKD